MRSDARDPGATPSVLFVIKSDGFGGVERKVAGLMEMFGRRGLACDVVVLARSATGLLAEFPTTVLATSARSGPRRRLSQLHQLRHVIDSKPYVAVIGFGPSPNAIVALARRRHGPRVVIAEVGDPFIARRRGWNRRWMWIYRFADVLVVQTERLAAELSTSRRRPRSIVVIPNFVSPSVPLVDPARPRQHVIVGVGRLVGSKRYDDLLEAFARLGGVATGWRVVIVGDGEARSRLEQLAVDRGIREQVTFPGWNEAPWEVLSDSSIFVLCSEHEGFPTVLVEAMASGCAVVSSDCRFGPSEVVGAEGSEWLYPVGDIDELVRLLGALIQDPDRRLAAARVGHERVSDFSPVAVTAQWFDLIGVAATA